MSSNKKIPILIAAVFSLLCTAVHAGKMSCVLDQYEVDDKKINISGVQIADIEFDSNKLRFVDEEKRAIVAKYEETQSLKEGKFITYLGNKYGLIVGYSINKPPTLIYNFSSAKNEMSSKYYICKEI
jgi:hypothetical protein